MSGARVLLAACAVLVALLLSACSSAEPSVRLVDPPTAVELIESGDVTVIDVRTPEEFSELHVDGAVNLDVSGASFRDDIDLLDPKIDYLVYCRSGARSAAAVEIMEEAGFVSIADAGALEDVAAEGAPVVASSP